MKLTTSEAIYFHIVALYILLMNHDQTAATENSLLPSSDSNGLIQNFYTPFHFSAIPLLNNYAAEQS